MQPRTNPTVLTTRDAVADLLRNPTDVLTWPVRTALASAFNYLDDALPVLMPPPASSQHSEVTTALTDLGYIAGRIQVLRADLLGLLEHLSDAIAEDIDPYAVGYAAGELGAALRELTQGGPA